VLHEQPRDGSSARERAAFASRAMIFTPQGLMLGAGTILVPAEGTRKLKSLKGREQQVLALLSAAYNTAVAPSVLGNIERAAKSWSEGDDFTAHIHLAHTGLRALDDFSMAAHRLRMAKGALDHGASPRAVFEVLHLDARYVDTLKRYNPAQPRVPAGHPDGGQWTSGDWADGEKAGENAAVGEKPAGAETQGSSVFARMPLPASAPATSFFSSLDAAQAARLGLFAVRMMTLAGGAAAVFGLLFIPSPDNVHGEEDVEGLPGWRYSWNRDETTLYLKYDRPGVPQRTIALRINDQDEVLDEKGKVVGKVIGGNKITIDGWPCCQTWSSRISPGCARTMSAIGRGAIGARSMRKTLRDNMRTSSSLSSTRRPTGPPPAGLPTICRAHRASRSALMIVSGRPAS
jgi:hypothetical protein